MFLNSNKYENGSLKMTGNLKFHPEEMTFVTICTFEHLWKFYWFMSLAEQFSQFPADGEHMQAFPLEYS